jgi:hypothetical protein
MILENSYSPDIFYETSFGVLVLDVPLSLGSEVEVQPMVLTNSSALPLDLSTVTRDTDHIGYTIRPHAAYRSLGTGLLIYYKSWLRNSAPLRQDEVFLSLKLPSLYAFSALNKLTVVTTGNVADRLHDYLTML